MSRKLGAKSKEGLTVKCLKCSYSWKTKSKRTLTACPKCFYFLEIEKGKEYWNKCGGEEQIDKTINKVNNGDEEQ